jgi:hypothetical protein
MYKLFGTASTQPWEIVKTPRAMLEEQMLCAQLRAVVHETRRCPSGDPTPDCWMYEDGSAFYTRGDGSETGCREKTFAAAYSLFPGKTVVRVRIWQTGFTNVWHEQVYIGRGYCVSFATDDQLVLARLARTSRTPAKFTLHFHAHANPVQVLTRATAALGAMQWDPYRINCQSVTAWIMCGQLPAKTAVAVAANEALFFSISLCGLICIVWAMITSLRSKTKK